MANGALATKVSLIIYSVGRPFESIRCAHTHTDVVAIPLWFRSDDDFKVECISDDETFWFVNSPIRLTHVATGGQLGTAKAAL